MFDLGFALVIADLILFYCIYTLNRHNEKVDRMFADPDPHILDEKLYEKRRQLQVDMIGFYILAVLLVLITIIFFVTGGKA